MSSRIKAKSNNCHMAFDGKSLDLYDGNRFIRQLEAMSGQPEYQEKRYQNMVNRGPIPEGIYYANQSGRQFIDPINAGWGIINKVLKTNRGGWTGSIPAWGLRRVWLEPDKNTNTYGRTGFSIHGGWEKGSAGCIDIPWQTDKLWDYMDECQETVPVYVKYPNESW